MRNILMAITWFPLVIVLFACNAPEPTTAPSPASSSSPIFPASFPSSTPVMIPSPAFTPSPALKTPGAAPSAVAVALAKTQAAQKYRVAMTLSVKQGNAPPFALDLKGEVSGNDAHYAYQLDSDKVEFTVARGQFFVKGARSIGLPMITKWYTLTPDLADAARPPFNPGDVLDSFAAQTARLAFQSLACEALDGQNCQVWRFVPKSIAETGLENVLGADQENSAFGALDQAEIKLWVCDDGAAHQLSVDIAAHNPKKSSEKGTAKLLLHIWDIENAAIKIDAPTGAEPFRLGAP